MVPAGGGGTFLGGFLVNKCRLRGAGVVKLCVLCTLTSLLATFVFFVQCPNAPMAGVTADYNGRSGSGGTGGWGGRPAHRSGALVAARDGEGGAGSWSLFGEGHSRKTSAHGHAETAQRQPLRSPEPSILVWKRDRDCPAPLHVCTWKVAPGRLSRVPHHRDVRATALCWHLGKSKSRCGRPAVGWAAPPGIPCGVDRSRGQVAQSASMPWRDGPLAGLVERDRLHRRGPHEGSAAMGGRWELGLQPLHSPVPEGRQEGPDGRMGFPIGVETRKTCP